MSTTLGYKGYDASVEYSAEDRTLHGRILGIRDMVTFEGDTVDAVERSFHAAVDEYLAFCREEGKEPSQAFSGTFNVRTGVALHRRAALYAEQHQQKLNSVVKEALSSFLERGR